MKFIICYEVPIRFREFPIMFREVSMIFHEVAMMCHEFPMMFHKVSLVLVLLLLGCGCVQTSPNLGLVFAGLLLCSGSPWFWSCLCCFL